MNNLHLLSPETKMWLIKTPVCCVVAQYQSKLSQKRANIMRLHLKTLEQCYTNPLTELAVQYKNLEKLAADLHCSDCGILTAKKNTFTYGIFFTATQEDRESPMQYLLKVTGNYFRFHIIYPKGE